MKNLSGKRALVCGASQGIGAAVAEVLAEAGVRVTVLARSEDKLKEVAAGLPGSGHRVMALDVAARAELAAALQDDVREHGAYEILICNSGGPKAGPIVQASDEDFLAGFQNHVLVNSVLVKTLLPGMREKGYGRIINIISTSVKIPIPNLGVSNTVRAAVASWAKTLSLELAPFGITVNNVLPGYTATPRLEALMEGAAARMQKPLTQVEEEWRQSVPMKRFADPREVAEAVGFLASPLASYITGVSLPVDGGRTGAL